MKQTTIPADTSTSNKKLSYLLMAAHLCDDVNQGALVALMPFLVLHYGYSYAAVTALLFASNAASAIIQPLFGWLGDRHQRPWLMAVGIFLAGTGIALIGVMPNYELDLAAAMVSGIGVAMFHPEGGRLANLVAGAQKGTGMSIFAVGGKLGFTFGPLLAAAAVRACPALLRSLFLPGFAVPSCLPKTALSLLTGPPPKRTTTPKHTTAGKGSASRWVPFHADPSCTTHCFRSFPCSWWQTLDKKNHLPLRCFPCLR